MEKSERDLRDRMRTFLLEFVRRMRQGDQLTTSDLRELASQTRYAGLFFKNNPKIVEFVAKVKTCGICYQAHEPGIYDPNTLWREGGEVFGS
jgi:hypothetical protein